MNIQAIGINIRYPQNLDATEPAAPEEATAIASDEQGGGEESAIGGASLIQRFHQEQNVQPQHSGAYTDGGTSGGASSSGSGAAPQQTSPSSGCVEDMTTGVQMVAGGLGAIADEGTGGDSVQTFAQEAAGYVAEPVADGLCNTIFADPGDAGADATTGPGSLGYDDTQITQEAGPACSDGSAELICPSGSGEGSGTETSGPGDSAVTDSGGTGATGDLTDPGVDEGGDSTGPVAGPSDDGSDIRREPGTSATIQVDRNSIDRAATWIRA
jgi:hypothetical protein